MEKWVKDFIQGGTVHDGAKTRTFDDKTFIDKKAIFNTYKGPLSRPAFWKQFLEHVDYTVQGRIRHKGQILNGIVLGKGSKENVSGTVSATHYTKVLPFYCTPAECKERKRKREREKHTTLLTFCKELRDGNLVFEKGSLPVKDTAFSKDLFLIAFRRHCPDAQAETFLQAITRLVPLSYGSARGRSDLVMVDRDSMSLRPKELACSLVYTDLPIFFKEWSGRCETLDVKVDCEALYHDYCGWDREVSWEAFLAALGDKRLQLRERSRTEVALACQPEVSARFHGMDWSGVLPLLKDRQIFDAFVGSKSYDLAFARLKLCAP